MVEAIHAFSQKRASWITGLTVRQLEYWDETDVLRPSVAAHDAFGLPRLYSFTDLLRLRVAKELRDHKMLPSEIRVMVDDLEQLGFDEPLLTIKFASPQGQGGAKSREVFWVNPHTGAVSSARAVSQAAEPFDLHLVEIRGGVEGRISDLLKRKPGHITRIRGLRGRAPVIAGTRVPTSKLKRLADEGWARPQIRAAFPHLNDKDVEAAIRYERKRTRIA